MAGNACSTHVSTNQCCNNDVDSPQTALEKPTKQTTAYIMTSYYQLASMYTGQLFNHMNSGKEEQLWKITGG